MKSYAPPWTPRTRHGASGFYKNVARRMRGSASPTGSSVPHTMPRAVLRGFVTFEGIDGSGKSTVSVRVAGLLRERGAHVFLTGEPTSHWLGDAIRRAYEDDVGPLAESFLFLADRAMHVQDIRARIEAGDLVLCDRYADSTYAYQGARLEGVVPRPLEFLRRISEPWLLTPDLTILLRLSAEDGLARIADRAKRVRFEDQAFLTKVASNYDVLANDARFAVIDARKPIALVVDESRAIIEKRLASRGRREGRPGPR